MHLFLTAGSGGFDTEHRDRQYDTFLREMSKVGSQRCAALSLFKSLLILRTCAYYIIKRSTRGHCFATTVPLTIWKVEDYQIVS